MERTLTENTIQHIDWAIKERKPLTRNEFCLWLWYKKCLSHIKKIQKYEQELIDINTPESHKKYAELPFSNMFSPSMMWVTMFIEDIEQKLEQKKHKNLLTLVEEFASILV